MLQNWNRKLFLTSVEPLFKLSEVVYIIFCIIKNKAFGPIQHTLMFKTL